MHPLAIIFIIIIGLLIFVLPRKFVFVPLLITVCYITYGQQINVFGLNFTIVRLAILFAWIRLIVRREMYGFKINAIDKVVIWWLVISLITHVLLWQTSGAMIYRLGRTYNAAGLYFLFRVLIRDLEEIETIIKMSAIIILPLSIMMLLEKFSGKNVFSIFGGMEELSWVRDGSVRSQGPFMWAGLAGTFGAIVMPFYASLWLSGKARFKAIIGFFAATVITITSYSGGPLMAYAAGIGGLLIWRFHRNMRRVRYIILFILILLQIVMKVPIWYLMTKLGNFTGGTAWHRSYLVDMAIKHINEWWLFGTIDTSAWMPYTLPIQKSSGELSFNADITNQFLLEGVEGGVISVLLFIAVITLCFRQIGASLLLNEDQPFSTRIIIWSLGVSLFVNVISFFSCTYFDQTSVIWYMLLAMISACSHVPPAKPGA